MAENDDIAIDSYLAEDIESIKSWFYTNLAPYMKYSHVCFNAEGVGNQWDLQKLWQVQLPDITKQILVLDIILSQ